MPAGKVSDVVPSNDEEDRAEQVYANASAKEKHSMSSSMGHFSKSNNDSVVSLAEGPLRKKFIKNYLVMSFRHKKGYKKMQTSNEIANTSSRFSDTVPMSQHKNYKEMGKFKGDLFIKRYCPHSRAASQDQHTKRRWSITFHSPGSDLRKRTLTA